MRNDVLEQISHSMKSFTKTQKKVASYIILNSMEAAFSTIGQIANSVETSTTTIVRFCIHLGFSGYAEFQRNLQNELKNRTAPSTKLKINLRFDGKDNFIKEIVNQQMENCDTTFNNLNNEMVFKTGELLQKAHRIYIFGLRTSYSIASFLNFNLNRIFNNCELINPADGSFFERITRISSNDVLITISMPRYVTDVVKVAKLAKTRGSTIVAITDDYTSPLSDYSDILFKAECKSSDFHNSVFSAMLIAEILIGICTKQNTQMVMDNLTDTETILRDFNVHVKK